MSKLSKRLLTTALCTTMLAGSSLTVGATGLTTPNSGTTQDMNNSVIDPIYSVTVPTAQTFAVDAFEQQGKGSQIVAGDISITNNSNVAIKMNVSLKLDQGTNAASVEFVDSADKVEKLNTSKKSAFVQAKIADGVTETKATAASYTTPIYKDTGDSKFYDDSSSGARTEEKTMEAVESVSATYNTSVPKYTLSETAIDFDFALAASEYVNYIDTNDSNKEKQQFKTTAASNNSSAAYTLVGNVNPTASWVANDFKVTAVYTFNGILTSDYEATVFETNAHALMKKIVPATDPTFASTTAGEITWSGDGGTGAVSDIVSVVINFYGTEYDLIAQTGDWNAATIDISNKKITLDSAVAATLGESSVTATIKYKDSTDGTPVEKTIDNVTVQLQ